MKLARLTQKLRPNIMIKKDKKINKTCPNCEKPVADKYRPFCSKRCADLDLGRWLDESYILPGDAEIPDAEDDSEK